MDLHKTEQTEPLKPKKSFMDVITDILSFVLIPFKFLKRGIDIVREDNASIRSFHVWHKKQKNISKRQKRFSDEF